jgi:hypothetical protein
MLNRPAHVTAELAGPRPVGLDAQGGPVLPIGTNALDCVSYVASQAIDNIGYCRLDSLSVA